MEDIKRLVAEAEDRSFLFWLDTINADKWDMLFKDDKIIMSQFYKFYSYDHPNIDYESFKEVVERFAKKFGREIIYGKNKCVQSYRHNYRRI